jgi:asparagine synthase (glutamine-hydrolysing)
VSLARAGSPAAAQGGPLLGLASQRLAVVDLSARAAQPMTSACGRYVLCYNGEIYNYRELRIEVRQAGDQELAPDAGDTQVLLACLARWGVECLPRLNGMWAFALFDREHNSLLLARDRLGVKPLFWSAGSAGLVVASEIKGILAATGQRYPLNDDVIARHLAQSLSNTDTQTMFQGIEAVPAGSFARIDLGAGQPALLAPRFQPFWRHPFERGEPLLAADPQELCALLQDAVRLRLRSDVPCGLLLSGGLDSSSILAAAHAQQLPLQVLSVISQDPASSEEYWVKQMARHCGVDPILIRIDEDPLSILADLDEASRFNDAPLPGLAMVAQQRLMQAASDHGITVLLTGQGADEQLGGYNKFFYFRLLELLRGGRYDEAARQAWKSYARGTVWGEFRWAEAKRYLPWQSARTASILGPRLAQAQLCETSSAGSYAEREWRDVHSLSLPLLLHSDDAMSMSRSRETRHPFVDYRIVEFLARVPPDQKFRDGWPKWILREAMRRHLPVSVSWRRDKKGFNIPEARWLCTAFVAHMERWLAGPMLCVEHGFVSAPALEGAYRRLLAGVAGASYKEVLAALTLESWLRVNEAHIAPA